MEPRPALEGGADGGGSAASVAAVAANTAAHGIEEAAKVKELRKFIDLDLEVFSSTEEADRREMEAELNNRRKWGGLLHPETTTSVIYNQMHVLCLLYMAYVLPVRTAFMIDPPAGSAEFIIDVLIDLFICIDIFLNFHKVRVLHTAEHGGRQQHSPSAMKMQRMLCNRSDMCRVLDLQFTKDGPELNTDKQKIRRDYLRGWFIIE